MYYKGKEAVLGDLFGIADVVVEPDCIRVGDRRFPVVSDVIILLAPQDLPAPRKGTVTTAINSPQLAKDIQYTFGEEWKSFATILSDHEHIFSNYFDLVDLRSLKHSRVCDLGCGMGRWSYFVKDHCRELVLVDFSEAIFVARETLRGVDTALFFMADLKALPFRSQFCDFVFSLGVLHHLSTPALEAVRSLKTWAPQCLVYLYYALDNRPAYFRGLLKLATLIRLTLCRIRGRRWRIMLTWILSMALYVPFLLAATALQPIGLSRWIPLEFYKRRSLTQIRQDVYDRFFTRIEQRVSRQEIATLQDTFTQVTISPRPPFWHFLCRT